MFTGLVEEMGRIEMVSQINEGSLFRIAASLTTGDLASSADSGSK